MAETLDVKQALAYCDAILAHTEDEAGSVCYTGVFSEYNNLLAGIDSQTGYLMTSGPLLRLEGDALDFCATLNQPYQVACALELSGYRNAKHESFKALERALLRCAANSHGEDLQAACLQNVAAVTRNIFYQISKPYRRRQASLR